MCSKYISPENEQRTDNPSMTVGAFAKKPRPFPGQETIMTQYRLLRSENETQRSRPAGWFDIRYTLILILTIVCVSCIYWIQFTDREICLVGVEGSVNRSLESPNTRGSIVPTTARPILLMSLSEADSFEQPLNETDIYKRFILYTDKCHLPFYDYNDPVVNEQYYSRKPQKCSTKEKPFIFYPRINMTGGYSCIAVNETLYQKFFAKSFKLTNCTYRQAVRDTDHFKIDYYHKLQDPKPLTVGSCPTEDLLWIECGATDAADSYMQPLFMPSVKPIAETIRGNNFDQKPLHVLVVGLDSVSRLNAYRQFPKTMAYLRQRENLVELFGYNKIGMNSAPNQIPLITGIPFKDFEDPGFASRAAKTHFDNLTRFLWDDFGSRGYRSLFLEEQWLYGLFLYPPLSGFLKAPTTYWPRPLMQAIDKSKLKHGTCVGPDQSAKLYLDYTYQTLKILGNERPLLAYSWLSEAAHDNINGGQLDDEYFLDFFTKMNDDKILDDTAVFFISDHGMRFDSFRNTPQGRFEDMLPYGFILMPDRYYAAYPQAKKILEINSRRLLTVLDLHASILEIADIWNEDRLIRTANGYSIFSNIIPFDRTCKQAGIDIEFCACYQAHSENTTTKIAWSLGIHIVDELNAKLKANNATQCSDYKLANVTEFIRLSEGVSWTNFFKASVELKPYARFEVTSEQLGTTMREWRILSDFDRTDRYSEHAKCAQGLPFEKYCYCK